MSPQEREQAVRKVIEEVGRVPPDFALDADLYTDLGLDSFRMVEIFLEIEKRFGVAISEEDYLVLRSPRQFLALVER